MSYISVTGRLSNMTVIVGGELNVVFLLLCSVMF